MNILLRFLRSLFGIYAGLCWVFGLIILIPFYFLVFKTFGKQAPYYAHRISRLWAKMLFVLILIRVNIKNKEFIERKKTYVFISNHQSLLDIPLFALSCKNTFRFLSKAELAKIPLFGYILRKLYITVNRTDKADKMKSIEAMKKSIGEGISVFLCPEGTRNKTERPLLNFKNGAFVLAVETKTPLAVLTIINSKKLLSPLQLVQLSPGTIHAVWSKPIETIGMTKEDIPHLKEMAKEIMLQNLSEYENGK